MGLFWIQLGCAVLIGILGRRRGGAALQAPPSLPNQQGAAIFTQAISSSASGMLVVCAYVAFFSSVIGALGVLLDQLSPSPIIDALLFGFFELSSGVSAAAAIDDAYIGAVLTAFAVGWSGLSVHFQIMSLTAGRGISYRPYLLAKAAQGTLCAVITALWLKLAPPDDLAPCTVTEAFYDLPGGYLHMVHLAFCAALIYAVISRLRKKFGKIR